MMVGRQPFPPHWTLSSWMPPHWLRTTAKSLSVLTSNDAAPGRCSRQISVDVYLIPRHMMTHTNLQVWVRKAQLQMVHLK